MNFRPHNDQDEVSLNITPLIDIVFLLLIFFMVTTTFDRHAELRIELPEAEQEKVAKEQRAIELVINADGRYFIDGTEVKNTQVDTLYSALAKVAAGDTKRALVIRGDANTTHQSVVTAMDVAARLGLSRLSIAISQTASE